MAYFQQYISDNVEEPSDIFFLQKQIEQLGFDPAKEVPKTFSLTHTTEGFDIYDEVRQNLQLNSTINNKPATISFVFRAIREEHDIDFRLIDIEARLYITEDRQNKKITEKYFGNKAGFPMKAHMINTIVDEAARLDKAKSIGEKSEKIGNIHRNNIGKNGGTFKP